ncbi:MAG: hypothetical protein VB077_11600 [Desulfitobacterium sp.]|nr:hypothetical protein [Desulfitobacterium sp.]
MRIMTGCAEQPMIASIAVAAGIVGIALTPYPFEDDMAANLFGDGGAIFI